MRAGQLRHSIVIQRQASSLNSYAENEGTWSPWATVRAGIEPLSGRELIASGQNLAQQNVRIVIRYRSGVTAQMRVVWGTNLYNIQAVINPEHRNAMLELMCVLTDSNFTDPNAVTADGETVTADGETVTATP